MDLDRLTARLSAFPDVVAALMAPIPDEDARWRPPGGGWSLLEIVWHLADEEVMDFRTRIERTLEDPAQEWPPIDPEGDILRLEYNQRDPAEAVTSLRTARGVSAGRLSRSMSERSTSARVCETVWPSNRRFPVSSSCSTTPNDQMSQRRSVG